LAECQRGEDFVFFVFVVFFEFLVIIGSDRIAKEWDGYF
jgi:hypothetical protein